MYTKIWKIISWEWFYGYYALIGSFKKTKAWLCYSFLFTEPQAKNQGLRRGLYKRMKMVLLHESKYLVRFFFFFSQSMLIAIFLSRIWSCFCATIRDPSLQDCCNYFCIASLAVASWKQNSEPQRLELSQIKDISFGNRWSDIDQERETKEANVNPPWFMVYLHSNDGHIWTYALKGSKKTMSVRIWFMTFN